MLRIALISCALLMSAPTMAQEVVEDAFGIVPQAALSPARAAWSGLRTTAGHSETVPPQAPQTVLIFAGAKSLVAGKDIGHAVALVLDPHGNLAGNPAGVDFTIGGARHEAAPIENGIADVLFEPGTEAGIFATGAAVGTLQSARALFRVTTDLGSVRPGVEGGSDPLVPEAFSSFATSPLRDRYGNQVEDGVALGFILAHDDGSASLMTGLARDGKAGTRLLTRDIAAGGALSAVLGANGSPEVRTEVIALTADAPVQVVAWAVPELDAMAVRVGPVTTSEGHLLTDGAPVALDIETATGARDRRTGWLRDGHFEALLPLSPGAAPVRATVESPLGRETQSVALSTAPTAVRGAE